MIENIIKDFIKKKLRPIFYALLISLFMPPFSPFLISGASLILIPKVFYYFLAFRKIQEEQFLLAKINRLKYLSWYFNFRKEIRRWAELCIDVFLFILLVLLIFYLLKVPLVDSLVVYAMPNATNNKNNSC